ncbi:hypothetical protein B7463_g9186, partial [Scytalidium lignicola]
MPHLSAQTASTLRKIADDAVADRNLGLPGTSVVVVGKDGKELFAHATGTKGYGSKDATTLDTVYWIASCTKIITGVAIMQLVEQGKLKLDDVEQVEQLAPELKAIKVLQDDGKLVEKKKGDYIKDVAYSYCEKIRDFNKPIGIDEFGGHTYDAIKQPLVNQPGEKFEYGINIDWAGILLERVTGLSLNDYMHIYIFEPLGLKNVSLFPTEEMKQRLVHMSQRGPDGTLAISEHIWRRPLIISTKQEVEDTPNSGGGGGFATPSDYCQILAVLLNNGVSPTTGSRLLKKSTVDEMFTNQLPHLPNFGREPIAAAKPQFTNPIPELYPFAVDPKAPLGWGLTFMLTPDCGGITGRKKGTAHWAGLPNLWWWCDREAGVAGMVCTQVLPFADEKVFELWTAVETAVYNGLKGEGSKL